MTNPDYTHLSLVADRSGSMISIKNDAEGGINSLIADQAAEEAGEITVSLYEFDSQYNKVFGPVAAVDAPAYTLTPRGSTALRDSVFKAIADTGDWLSSLDEAERPSKVIFAIITDGGENTSREVSQDQLKSLITTQTEVYDWEFLYLGANVDAFAVGGGFGIKGNTNYAASAAGTQTLYSSLSDAVVTSRRSKGVVGVASAMPKDIDADGNATFGTSTSETA